MKQAFLIFLGVASCLAAALLASTLSTSTPSASAQPASAPAVTLTIATVDNPDMVRMQELSRRFTAAHPTIALEWITLNEGLLRQRVSTDIAIGSGRFDVVTIGTYEVPLWAERGWLTPLDGLPASYDVADLLPPIRDALSVDGTLYAAPFYGESSFTMYRTDLFESAGLQMPEAPTWDQVEQFAAALHDPADGVYGICLRGKPGWGENLALLTAMANSYGARWFDEDWRPQFDTQPWANTLDDYLMLLTEYGPPDASENGYNETLALFQNGECAVWIDATVAASSLTDPQRSRVAEDVGFALAPDTGLGKRSNWLWAWALGVSAGSPHQEAAETFVAWATSREYTELVAEEEGWANAPPGTRASLYENADYLAAAPFAEMALASIQAADPDDPTVERVPYTGIQFVAIPEFQSIGTAVGHRFAKALDGSISSEEALANAQWVTEKVIARARFLAED